MEPTPTSRKRWPLVLGGLALLLLFAVAARFLLWAAPVADPDAERAAERSKALADLKVEDEKKLNTYAVVDQAAGHYQIPIKEAMALTVAGLKDSKPTAAGPISTPTPAPAASPAASPQASP
jgi:hypothetical protein